MATHFTPNPPPLAILYTVSVCGVDKKDLKWREIQLAVHCGESSLIAIK